MRSGRAFTEMNPLLLGVVGTVVLTAVLLAALNFSRLPFLQGGREYQAQFTEVGNINAGDDVVLAGLKVGEITDIRLTEGLAEVTFVVSDDDVRLGSETTADIATLTVLGKRGLRLTSAGPGVLEPGSTIPASRTGEPYDLTQAISGLTRTTEEIDTTSVTSALDAISGALRQTPPSMKAAVRGLSRLSGQMAARDDDITRLLASARSVTSVLARREDQIRVLLQDGNTLLGEVYQRRREIVQLLAATSRVADQLSGLVDDNAAHLAPALRKLERVTQLLNSNRANIDRILGGAAVFATALGESIGNGPFFSAYVQNLGPQCCILPALPEVPR